MSTKGKKVVSIQAINSY